MLLDERRAGICDLVRDRGFATLSDLADAVGASESTVRRDLDFLTEAGELRRTRGGAAAVDPLSVRQPLDKALAQKQAIAKAAAGLIGDGETILIDGGTTTLELARHLVGKRLQIVTNSLPIMQLLSGADGIELVCLGGVLHSQTGVLLGPMTTAALERLHVRRTIMGTGGVLESGLFNSNSLLVETERQMIAAADETVVLADAEKFGHSELVRLCGLDDVDRLVTDSRLGNDWRRTLRSAGVDVRVV